MTAVTTRMAALVRLRWVIPL